MRQQPLAENMNKYTFHWTLAPPAPVEYSISVAPFEVVARGNTLTLTTTADASAEQSLREQANEVAHNLARGLSFEHGERFEVASTGYDVLTPGGGQRASISCTIIAKGAVVLATCGAAAVEIRDAAGNVIDSPAIRQGRELEVALQRLTEITKRAALDANLRDMLDHWTRYDADDGRLHPLYDVLQVAERVYGGRKKASSALNLSDTDLSDLGRISNDPTVLNGRHPGESPGPHRIATKAEVNTCERVARAIIGNYAATIVI
jgi:hypothetical protein